MLHISQENNNKRKQDYLRSFILETKPGTSLQLHYHRGDAVLTSDTRGQHHIRKPGKSTAAGRRLQAAGSTENSELKHRRHDAGLTEQHVELLLDGNKQQQQKQTKL